MARCGRRQERALDFNNDELTRRASQPRCRSDRRRRVLSSLLGVAALAALSAAVTCTAQQKPPRQTTPLPAKFVDVTSALGVQFQHAAPHTSRKYLLETMGSGVALFDYDNDGKLDLFLVNGAEINDPSPTGTVPKKTGPKYWNRLYHQKPDGTFEDVTEKAGLQ